ncbi:hypothetical protein DOT_0411 [Desulfosporosinus sp. OT]|nr:hypothetical protein DOT_0411 [Desulfosporosinus sp. OT]
MQTVQELKRLYLHSKANDNNHGHDKGQFCRQSSHQRIDGTKRTIPPYKGK